MMKIIARTDKGYLVEASMNAPRISKAQGRDVQEWYGKSPNSKPPPRVLLRILRRYNSTCYLTNVEIRDGDYWEAEHIKTLEDGGENRESNLAPALKKPHIAKTKAENRARAKADKKAKAAFGIKKRSRWALPCGKGSKWRKKLNGK